METACRMWRQALLGLLPADGAYRSSSRRGMMSDSCIFCRIARGEIPARMAYEGDDVVAFHDIDPKAPVHILVIPRRHIPSVNALEPGDAEGVGRLYLVAQELAKSTGVAESGYRLVMNTGPDAGQSVDHIHLHLLAGRSLHWPPG